MKTREIQFETFKKIGDFETKLMIRSVPHSYHGDALIKRFKVTINIEEIPESLEVYQHRIQTLWEQGNNSRHLKAIYYIAKSIGYSLKGEFGSKSTKV